MALPIIAAAAGGVFVGSILGAAIVGIATSSQISDDDLIRIGDGEYVMRERVTITSVGSGVRRVASKDKEVPWAVFVSPPAKKSEERPQIVSASA